MRFSRCTGRMPYINSSLFIHDELGMLEHISKGTVRQAIAKAGTQAQFILNEAATPATAIACPINLTLTSGPVAWSRTHRAHIVITTIHAYHKTFLHFLLWFEVRHHPSSSVSFSPGFFNITPNDFVYH